MIEGTISQQFAVLYNYAAELMVRNLCSTIVISPLPGTLATGRPIFARMYVCLCEVYMDLSFILKYYSCHSIYKLFILA